VRGGKKLRVFLFSLQKKKKKKKKSSVVSEKSKWGGSNARGSGKAKQKERKKSTPASQGPPTGPIQKKGTAAGKRGWGTRLGRKKVQSQVRDLIEKKEEIPCGKKDGNKIKQSTKKVSAQEGGENGGYRKKKKSVGCSN